MATFEALLILLVVVGLLGLVGRKVPIPGPILLIAAGIGLGELPGFPHFALAPDLLFVLFVPPLIYTSATQMSPREVLKSWQPIFGLAVVLVLVTMGAVAWVAHGMLPGFGWALAFVLGAILAPPDAVAVLETLRGLKLPRDIAVILEGESLLNDAVALVAYKFAVAATVTGTFSLLGACLSLPYVVVLGVLAGLVTGYAYMQVRKHIELPQVDATMSLVAPYAAYFLADRFGASGVLATLTLGILVGWYGPATAASEGRLQTIPMWDILEFLLGGLVFLLMGLALPAVLKGLAGTPIGLLAGAAGLTVAVVIAVRVPWVFGMAWLHLRGLDKQISWPEVGLVSWSGLRGVDTLVTALALPLVVAGGAPFPHRSLVVFLAFMVILATLFIQGLTLPFLIRYFGLAAEDEEAIVERRARITATRAALRQLGAAGPNDSTLAHQLRRTYEERLRHYEGRPSRRGPQDDGKAVVDNYHARLHEALAAERQALSELRHSGEIGGEVHQKLLRELDLADAQHHH